MKKVKFRDFTVVSLSLFLGACSTFGIISKTPQEVELGIQYNLDIRYHYTGKASIEKKEYLDTLTSFEKEQIPVKFEQIFKDNKNINLANNELNNNYIVIDSIVLEEFSEDGPYYKIMGVEKEIYCIISPLINTLTSKIYARVFINNKQVKSIESNKSIQTEVNQGLIINQICYESNKDISVSQVMTLAINSMAMQVFRIMKKTKN